MLALNRSFLVALMKYLSEYVGVFIYACAFRNEQGITLIVDWVLSFSKMNRVSH
jgi:hypothetical protein